MYIGAQHEIEIRNLDANSSVEGLPYDIWVKLTLSFPNYPANRPVAALPRVFAYTTQQYTLSLGENTVLLPAGTTVVGFHYQVDSQYEGYDYHKETNLIEVKVELEPTADTASFQSPQTYQIHLSSPEDDRLRLTGVVATGSPVFGSLIDFYKVPDGEMRAAFETLGFTNVTAERNLQKLLRAEWFFDPTSADEVILMTSNRNGVAAKPEGMTTDWRYCFDGDIPSWIRETHPPAYLSPIYDYYEDSPEPVLMERPSFEHTSQTNALLSYFWLEYRVGMGSWTKIPYRRYGDTWQSLSSDNTLINAFVESSAETLGIDYSNVMLPYIPAGATALRATYPLQTDPLFSMKENERDPRGILSNYNNGIGGVTYSLVLHNARKRFGAVGKRDFAKRTPFFISVDFNDVVNNPDQSYLVPSILLEDGSALLTENSMVIGPESNVQL